MKNAHLWDSVRVLLRGSGDPDSRVLGYRVGADFRLASFDESIAHFQTLDDASDRLELFGDGEGAALAREGEAINGLSDDAIHGLAGELRLRVGRSRASGVALPRPPVGLYRPRPPSMDEGWTRWRFERYGIDFVNLRDAEFHAGGVREGPLGREVFWSPPEAPQEKVSR